MAVPAAAQTTANARTIEDEVEFGRNAELPGRAEVADRYIVARVAAQIPELLESA